MDEELQQWETDGGASVTDIPERTSWFPTMTEWDNAVRSIGSNQYDVSSQKVRR